MFGTSPVRDPSLDIEHQLDLVRCSIALLAGGGARRVTLVGLPVSERTLREAGALARASGMLLRSAPHGSGHDITVEASG